MKYDISIEIKGLKDVSKNYFEAKLGDFIEEFQEVCDSVGIIKRQIYEENRITVTEPFYIGTPPINNSGILNFGAGEFDITNMSISNGKEKVQAYVDEDGLHWRIKGEDNEYT